MPPLGGVVIGSSGGGRECLSLRRGRVPRACRHQLQTWRREGARSVGSAVLVTECWNPLLYPRAILSDTASTSNVR